MLTDRNANKGIAVTIWETESDARASETGSHIQDVIKRFEGMMAGAPTFEYYEVSVDY